MSYDESMFGTAQIKATGVQDMFGNTLSEVAL
jgi:hypothetical protein